jgi:hypothetical protein
MRMLFLGCVEQRGGEACDLRSAGSSTTDRKICSTYSGPLVDLLARDERVDLDGVVALDRKYLAALARHRRRIIIDRPARLLMNHAISADVHQSYMTPGSMFDQLREANEAAPTYIMWHLPKGAEGQLTRRLREQLTAL